MYNKASQNRQQAGWTRFTRLCWQALGISMKPEEVLNAIYSLDNLEAWKAAWEIIRTKNTDLTEFYLPHLKEIREAVSRLPAPDKPAMRDSRDSIKLALKILESVAEGKCKCSVYLETEQILPESQEKFGLVEVKEKRWDAKAYEDDIECSCTECGQDFNCRVNHGYHYPWSKWVKKTKGYTLNW